MIAKRLSLRNSAGNGKYALVGLLATLAIGLAVPSARGVADYRGVVYEYSSAEVIAATEKDLNLSLASYKKTGQLNRETPELMRVKELSAALIKVAMQESEFARTLDWRIYLHEGRAAEAYSRAGGQIIVSAGFLERYHPDNAELAFVIGHEIAHVLCQHERIRLSAVWRRNAPQRLLAQYAMEYLDTEPMVRAQIADIANSQERTADQIGIELAAAIGVNPLAALRFFDKSAAKDGGGIMPDVHDPPVERKAALLHDITAYPPQLAMRRGHRLNCAP
jgi:predicted Zn-dependent protease